MAFIYPNFAKLSGSWQAIIAANKLRQHSITLVFQLVMNADLGGVIALNRQVFQVAKKSDLGQIGNVVVVGEDSENCDSFFGARIDEEFPVVVLAHGIDQAKPFPPIRFLIVIDTFSQYLLDIVGHLGCFRAAGLAIGGNNRLRQLLDQCVLCGSEESRGRLGFADFFFRRD